MEEKQVSGLSRYWMGADGQVRSTWLPKKKVISGGRDKDGYVKFSLVNDKGEREYHRRSTLICRAFHGERPEGMVVRHIDGSRLNDRPDNLEWASQKDNIADKERHGTSIYGETSPTAKIPNVLAAQIKQELESGVSPAKLVKELGLPRNIVYGISSGRTWRWLDWRAELAKG